MFFYVLFFIETVANILKQCLAGVGGPWVKGTSGEEMSISEGMKAICYGR